MAGFNVNGLDGLLFDLETVANMPESVQDEILNAGADVVVAAQKRKIREYGIYDPKSSKHVADSIKKGRPATKKGQRVISISPKGTRRRGEKTTRNAEILFVNEFGKKGQKCRPAVRDANEESAEDVASAELRVWDDYLNQNNL